MNKKFQELAKEAGYKPLPGFDFANSIEEIYLEKFANLILEDVMQTLIITGHEKAVDELNKHFGFRE